MKNRLLKKLILPMFLLLGSIIYAQSVSGTVSDKTGIPIPGVNVIVKGTSTGTVTDFDGNYALDTNAGSTLVFSYIGYQSQNINYTGQTTLNVTLNEDASILDEVVVVGYGTKKKSLVTGAISSIDSERIGTSSNQRVEQVIQGRTSGVTVSSSSGAPGAGAKIRIRGAGSSGNSEPLYIVDGMKTSSIEDIAPSDIANIEILKDAASSSIYGTEGANGVVIINTKSGRAGDLRVSFNSQTGVQFVNTSMDLMDASQFTTYMNEAGIGTVFNNGYNTNWIDETFSTAMLQRYDVNISGGSEKFLYYASASHLDQDGVVGRSNSNFKRTTFRTNLKSKIGKVVEIGLNATYSLSDRNGIQENSDTRGVIQNMLILDPLTPVTYAPGQVPQSVIDNANANNVPLLTDKSGNVYGYPAFSTGEVLNPVAYGNEIDKTNYDEKQFLASVYLKLNLAEGLSVTSRFGFDQGETETQTRVIPYYVSSEAANTAYSGSQEQVESTRWLWENFVTYEKSFGSHNFKLMAGYSAEDQDIETPLKSSGSVAIADFTDWDFDLPGFNTQVDIVDPYYDNMVSLYSRLSYDYDDKYLFEASVRSDKSDKFPTDNKTGIFPSFSAGWILSNEGFWNTDSGFNYLKFRASWGQNGSRSNLDGNSDKTYITNIIDGQSIDYLGNQGAEITGYANPNLVWETSEQFNVGMDLRAINNKLSFSADYYKKTTRDAIVKDGSLITPGSAGFLSNEFNSGTIENSGLEFELGFNDTCSNGFSYSISANLSTLKNEVTEILFVPDGTSLVGAGAPQNADGITRFSEGLPSWYFYGFKTDGIDPNTGEVVKVDTNNDGNITNADKTMIGSPHPDLLYGGNINLAYKAFDFNLQFQGTAGNDIVSVYHQPSRPITNKPIHFYENRWQQPGDNASYPGAAHVIGSYDTDLMVEDGSYMRIKQIQFGYTLPEAFLSQLKIKHLRLYLSLDDYFTFTQYSGLDPEIGNFNYDSIGVDRGFYPTAAKALFGLSLNF
ncbi:SusC/RagA family TonB-linked outer membrane protein [Tamlana agarivorans]|uniref:SusC/RagA family TonB-linked outer membrane protein n=1 Tax=Pseudotamlana agarivorans TaxID=481183 RepID=A0ACC5U6H7_9FLAO|nr:SusC/RagA family TonB-linked outer membrane protein [Tamlana agarivorans]MBU2949917.1 SusC/RagA family TonB-linked outer membrane protein [Tamlana agarivorans]